MNLTEKRLQVFISSTYKDLKLERQSVVEAILDSGHIPAGMELFTAGNQSQMDVIKLWIRQSDVFVLILGGCYGSIDHITQKSYTQLEYEYAISINKPFFSVVVSDAYLEKKIQNEGLSMIERENSNKYNEFKAQVLSKVVQFWGSLQELKYCILHCLQVFSQDENLVGWVRGDIINNSVDLSKAKITIQSLTNTINRLNLENIDLLKGKANSLKIYEFNDDE
jgi:Domain of unknown function (DUF4062)